MMRVSQSLRFLLIQCANLILIAALLFLLKLPFLFALLMGCLLVLILAWYWHDGRWWLLIHAGFLPLAWGMWQLDIPPYWYFLAFILSWLVLGPVARSRVPLYLSNQQALHALEKLLPQGTRLIDVGAGTGTVLAWLSRRRPDLVLCGAEHAWLPWLIGRLRLPARVGWYRQDYNKLDLSAFDVVYAFLSSEPMPCLWQKICREMLPGSLLVSNTFAIPDLIPDQEIALEDWKGGKLLLWQIKS